MAEARAKCFRQKIGQVVIDELDGGVHGAANLAGAEGDDGCVEGDEPVDFGGIEFLGAEDLNLRIDQCEARGAELSDFGFAVKDEELPGFQAAFEIATVKKFAGKRAAGFVLDKQMIDGIAPAAHAADGLAAHDASANGVGAVRLDVLHLGKMDTVFVAKREVAEQVLERADAALREEFGALRADALDHAYFGAEVHGHLHDALYHSYCEHMAATKLASLPSVSIE